MKILIVCLSLGFFSNLRAEVSNPASQDIYLGIGDLSFLNTTQDTAYWLLGYEGHLLGSQSWRIQAKFAQSSALGYLTGGDIGWHFYFNQGHSLSGPFLGALFEIENSATNANLSGANPIGPNTQLETLYGPGLETGYQWTEGHLVINIESEIRWLFSDSENNTYVDSYYSDYSESNETFGARTTWEGIQISFGWIP